MQWSFVFSHFHVSAEKSGEVLFFFFLTEALRPEITPPRSQATRRVPAERNTRNGRETYEGYRGHRRWGIAFAAGRKKAKIITGTTVAEGPEERATQARQMRGLAPVKEGWGSRAGGFGGGRGFQF